MMIIGNYWVLNYPLARQLWVLHEYVSELCHSIQLWGDESGDDKIHIIIFVGIFGDGWSLDILIAI